MELWQWDVRGFRAIHLGLHSPALDPFFAFLSYSALGVTLTLVILAALAIPACRNKVCPLLLALLFGGGLLADGMKAMIHRPRPSNLSFAIPQEPFWQSSFPSGHTASAFSVAVMALLLTKGTKHAWIGQFGFVWAILVGISRIYRGIHWPSDVIGGALCGILGATLAWQITLWFGNKTDPDDERFNAV